MCFTYVRKLVRNTVLEDRAGTYLSFWLSNCFHRWSASPSPFWLQDQISGFPLLCIFLYHLRGNEYLFLHHLVPQIALLFYFQIAGSSAHEVNWSFPLTSFCNSFENGCFFFLFFFFTSVISSRLILTSEMHLLITPVYSLQNGWKPLSDTTNYRKWGRTFLIKHMLLARHLESKR